MWGRHDDLSQISLQIATQISGRGTKTFKKVLISEIVAQLNVQSLYLSGILPIDQITPKWFYNSYWLQSNGSILIGSFKIHQSRHTGINF
jgi:hypothetical protein